MKINLLTFLLLFTILSFSQEKKTIKSGYITFNSGSILDFKNLVIDNENAVYFNEVSQTEMKFSLQSVKKIIDGSGLVIYESSKVLTKKIENINNIKKNDTIIAVDRKEELVYKSVSKILMSDKKISNEKLETLLKSNTDIYSQYKKGKNGAMLGDILIGGGIGLIIGGGISNLLTSNSGNEGSPAILIVGVVTSVVGIPIKIAGVKNVKEAVQNYNFSLRKEVIFFNKSELNVIAGANGIGFQLRF